MTEFFRSDKIAGLITGTFGLTLIVFGGFGLVIVALQRLMMQTMPPSPDHFDEMINAIQGTWITYFPFMIAGGLVFGVAGFYIYRGSLVARRIAQANTILGLIWVVAYSITSYRVMQNMLQLPLYQKLPIYQSPVFQWGTIVLNLIILLAFPTALFYILRRPTATIEARL